MKKRKTTESLLDEVFIILILFVLIGAAVYWMVGLRQDNSQRPAVKDLHQQQEMIDYHRGEGREIVSFG